MIISDLDYLDSILETSAMHLNGSGARAFSKFSAEAYGKSTNISAFVKNLAISKPNTSISMSSVAVSVIALDGEAFVSASSASFS